MRAASSGSAARRRTPVAIAWTSPSRARNPVRWFSTISATPPTRVATTGLPKLMVSSTPMPKRAHTTVAGDTSETARDLLTNYRWTEADYRRCVEFLRQHLTAEGSDANITHD